MNMKYLGYTCLAVLLAIGSVANAADAPDPTGKWDIVVDMGGSPLEATLDITKNDDGTYAGVLDSPMGPLEVDKVDYTPGETIGFTQTIGEGDAAMEFSFDGKFTSDDAFEGVLKSQMGEMPVTGKRAGSDAGASVWDMVSESDIGTIESVFTMNADGTASLSNEADGTEVAVNDLKRDGDMLTYAIVFELDGQEIPLDFEGKIDGNSLTGEYLMQGSPVATVTANKRMLGGIPLLVGSWDILAESPVGDVPGTMVVAEDGTAKFIWEDGESEAENFTVDNEYIEFDVNVLYQGAEYFVSFEGEIASATELGGDFILDGSPVAQVKGTKK